MGPDAEDMRAERGRKPSLQSRLQSGLYRLEFHFLYDIIPNICNSKKNIKSIIH